MKYKQLFVIINTIVLLVTVFSIIAPASAQITNPAPGVFVDFTTSTASTCKANTFACLFTFFIKQILVVVGVLAIFFVIIGGVQYLVSGANEEWAESGKKTLTNAIIGLVIIILSYVIVNVINNALG